MQQQQKRGIQEFVMNCGQNKTLKFFKLLDKLSVINY